MGMENVAANRPSADGKLYVGMTREEAYRNLSKEDYSLFNFADDNNDDVIDEAEIRRYNGPLLAVEKDDRTKQRFIGQYSGIISYGNVDGQVITSKEFGFYPGQKYDEIKDKDFNLAFRDLDLNSDGELSKEEIETYQAYVARKNELKQTIKENEYINFDNSCKSIVGGAAGLIAGSIGGYFISDLVENMAHNFIYKCKKFRFDLDPRKLDTEKVPKLLDKLGHGNLNWVVGIGVAAIGITAGLLIAKSLHKKRTPLEKFDDLKPIDEQYKNVYNE